MFHLGKKKEIKEIKKGGQKKKMKQYKNRIYNPNGPPTHYGHSRPMYESKRKGSPYGSAIEKHLEKLVPVEKEKQDLALELEMKEIEAEVNDFSLDEHRLEKEAELELKEFLEEEEDIEIGHA